jgi:hypothetical protein
MEYENSLTPQESLGLIADAISKTRDNIRENSFGFLLWGWLITIASFSYFALRQYSGTPFYFIPFPILAVAGIVATLIFLKRKTTGATLTYTNYFIHKMWIVLGISFFVVVFINVAQGKMPFTYTLVIAGIGTLVSGWVMKFRPLTVGGALFLASAVASIYIADPYKPLLHGIVIIAGYLIPGYLLRNSKV